MKTLLYLFSTVVVLNVSAQEAGVIKLSQDKLHARVREWPYPVGGTVVSSNAPALMWPATNGTQMVLPMESGSEVPQDPGIADVRYKVVLARDSKFTKNVITSDVQAWAVYPLHQSLAPGSWYWKYAYAKNGSDSWTWSQVYDFVIDAKTQGQQVSPPVNEVLARNQATHPRLWDMHTRGEVFYKNNLNNPEAHHFIAYAEKLMREPLPAEKPMRVIDTTGKTPLEKKKIIEAMYHGFGDAVGTPISNLCIAYQLTKDERFLRDAKRRALNIAQMDPNGLATGDDFTSGAVLEALGWFYDAGYHILTEKEKSLFQQIIKLRAKRVYDHLPNRFELHVSDNHIWQITMRNLTIATVAVMGDVPEAKEWLSYLYEVWSARYPVLGTTDGGWHEGNGYFKVNYKSMIYLSQLFGDLSGVDYYQLPWMKNLPFYLLYTHPPASATTAYGDMWENTPFMTRQQGLFADAFAYRAENPYLNWYVATIKKDNHEYFTRPSDDYLFYRLLHYNPNRKLPQQSPRDLPKLRNFADVGVAAIHSNLADTKKDLSSYLMSNPFGSSGHGSASQNAITVNFKGKTVFGGSGYYGNFSDQHNLLYYRTSRAYSTILVDSLSQKIGEEGYGWIPRALSGERIQYALGDASNAYGAIESSFWLNRFEQLGIDPKSTGVYGDVGVQKYRRHMVQLEGGIIVLYDELEAKQPIKWTTQFHAPYYAMKAIPATDNNAQNFEVLMVEGHAAASVFAAVPIGMKIHHKFSEPAVNWANVKDVNGDIKEFKEQWHCGVTSIAVQKMRYLTVLQVKDGKPQVIKRSSNGDGLTVLQIDNWQITVQLDGLKPAKLQIADATSVFDYGSGMAINFAGKKYTRKQAGSTLLIEGSKGKVQHHEAVDVLPDVVKYDAVK